jgi:hypothetical protein
MSSANVYVVVKGYTEQTFVREVLAPEMAVRNVFLHPVLIGKPGHKGGNITFERAKRDVAGFLKQRSDTHVSTMFDYFRLDPRWPGNVGVRRSSTAIEKAQKIEAATLANILELFPGHDVGGRFIPYIEMHEFEALLFSDASILANELRVGRGEIEEVLDEFREPEEINDGQDTAPSKRLIRLYKGYRKVAMGKAISEAIGISTMREKCPHFDDWVTKLERLGGE